jgi:ribosome-binding factor A
MKKLEIVSSINKSAHSHRLEKLASVIRFELGKLLTREVEFPLGVLVTITGVTVLSDLSTARVKVSVLPFARGKEALDILHRAVFNLQHLIRQKLKIYHVPKLEFYIDEAPEKAGHIEHILDSIKQGE